MSTNPYFIENVTRSEASHPVMPFFHTCDAYFLKAILSSKQLSTTLCPIFKQNILYLFYGRPAYKSSITENNDLKSLLPVTFIINNSKISLIKRLFPFDSGAFEKGLYNTFLHPKMKIEEFLLKPHIDSLLTTVDYFFGENVFYYDYKPKKVINHDPLDFQVESYHNLINNGGRTVVDDRKASFEVQIDDSISLTNENILAIIIPNCLQTSKEVSKIENDIGIPIISYRSFGICSNFHYTQILQIVRDFLINNNYCYER